MKRDRLFWSRCSAYKRILAWQIPISVVREDCCRSGWIPCLFRYLCIRTSGQSILSIFIRGLERHCDCWMSRRSRSLFAKMCSLCLIPWIFLHLNNSRFDLAFCRKVRIMQMTKIPAGAADEDACIWPPDLSWLNRQVWRHFMGGFLTRTAFAGKVEI